MSGNIPTKGAPKSLSELKELLKDDIKVKVAGSFKRLRRLGLSLTGYLQA
jgi:hypothetical protein